MQQKTLDEYKVVGDPWKDAETMRRLYLDEMKSIRTIADELGCGSSNIKRWLDRHGIETRSAGHPPADWDLTDSDILRELYVEKRLSTAKIAEKYDCSRRQVSRWLKKHNIPVRSRGVDEYHPKRATDIDDRDLLYELYIEKDHTAGEVGEITGHAPRTVLNYLRKNEIPVVKPVAGRTPLFEGAEWLYQTLFRSYDGNWDCVKKQVRERDGNRCQMCFAEADELENALHVHHIIPLLFGGTHDPDMQLSLCARCHRTVEPVTRSFLDHPLLEDI